MKRSSRPSPSSGRRALQCACQRHARGGIRRRSGAGRARRDRLAQERSRTCRRRLPHGACQRLQDRGCLLAPAGSGQQRAGRAHRCSRATWRWRLRFVVIGQAASPACALALRLLYLDLPPQPRDEERWRRPHERFGSAIDRSICQGGGPRPSGGDAAESSWTRNRIDQSSY